MAGTPKILSTAVVRWRHGDDPRVTVIVKATFALSASGMASLATPEPIVDDLHHDRNEGRSLAIASDRAPRKAHAEVLFLGSAHAPPGERVARCKVRLAVISAAGASLCDKSLTVIGARRVNALTGATSAPEPFERMPIQWELAFGGARLPENPVGVGYDAKDARAPSVVSDAGAKIAAGLGPIDPRWPPRARKLRGASIAGASPTLPRDFDFSFFDAAPDDQRVATLHGDETLLLVGLHPTLREIRCVLPGVRPSASIRAGGSRIEVPLVCDTMSIQGDALTCSLVWRGDVGAPPELGEGDVEVEAQLAAFASRAPAAPKKFKETQRLVTHPPVEPPPPRSLRSAFGTTMAGDPAFAFPDVPAPLHVPPIAAPRIEFLEPAPSSSMPETIAAPETMAMPSMPTNFEEAPPRDELPDGHFDPPPRAGDLVPIVDTSPYVSLVFTSQLKPPQEVLIVAVKATFDLGERAATLADEQMLPVGDLHHDDDPKASLRYASDFVPFKPKADVLLVGSAPAGAEGNVAFVTLTVGKLERRLAIFGDRTWRTLGATDAAKFDRMPLRWERALGGPLSKDNPVGVGHGTATMVPNLEDPERLLDRPGAVLPPACMAPVASGWRSRASKLGTYDRKWLRARWPYFPEDFDPAYFNAAPKEQQVAYLEGGEKFRVTGVAEHALNGRIPDARPRVFAQRTGEAGGELIEVRTRLDTVWFDVDARKMVVVWRGFVDVKDDDAPDVSLVFVAMDEDRERPMKIAEARKRLHAALVARNLLKVDAPVDVQAANESAVSLRTAYARVRASKPPEAAPKVETPKAPAVDAEPLLEAIAAKRSVAGEDFTGVDLTDRDLSGTDLSGAVLARARLSRCNLEGAKLVGAVLAGATGESVSFAGADLSRADLSGVELDHADFSRAKLDDAVFAGARCTASRFLVVTGARASFVRARLPAANFTGAKLPRAELVEATIEDATFAEGDLSDARLYDVEGRGARFHRAKLTGLRADGAKLERATFSGVDAEESIWDRAQLSDAIFDGGKLRGSSFARAHAERGVFVRADLRDACFRRARLRRAKMPEANLARATFERAVLDEADLRGANLYQAETWKASCSSARLELAFLAGTKLA